MRIIHKKNVDNEEKPDSHTFGEKGKVSYKGVVAGFLILALILPVSALFSRAGQPIVNEDVPETDENNQIKWVASENSDFVVYDNDYPDATDTDVDGVTASENYEDFDMEEENQPVYPMPAWLDSILQWLAPILMGISGIFAIVSSVTSQVKSAFGTGFDKLKSVGKKYVSNNFALSLSQSGQGAQIQGLVMGWIFALVGFIVMIRLLPTFWKYATQITGMMGLRYLVLAVPFLLVAVGIGALVQQTRDQIS